MGRADRRRKERENHQEARLILDAYNRAQRKEAERIALKAANEAADYTRHLELGRCFTAFSAILGDPPYRWNAAKVSRLLDRVSAIMNDLNEGVICDADLVAHAEKRGIRILWDANHKYIQEVNPYEVDAKCED